MNFFKKLFLKHCIVANNNPQESVKLYDAKYYYRAIVTCKNCETELTLYIKKGLYVKYETAYIKCSYCGCKADKEIK